MISLILFIFLLNSHAISTDSNCSSNELCHCDPDFNRIICDGNYGNQTDNNPFPSLSILPSVEQYIFRNFKQIPENAFENLTSLTNQSIHIYIFLVNISIINSEAFSTRMNMPQNSAVSIDIGDVENSLSIIIRSNAFNRIKLQRLRFLNINSFNGRPIFDTNVLGEHLYVNELIFEDTILTGFMNVRRGLSIIKNLYIRSCPSLTQLTDQSLPSFISTTELLEISNSGLELIHYRTFHAWSLVLKELIIRNNTKFQILSSGIVEGVLMNLNKLDLSSNPINVIENQYNWFPFSYTNHLILKQQQIDIFLKTNILKTLTSLITIDFTDSFVSETNDNFILDSISSLPKLALFNISNTNFTDGMIINLLTRLSESANNTIGVSLLGRTLNESNFCSYFTIFQKAPNLLRLELDETHPCNCIIDLFYQETYKQVKPATGLFKQPSCLSNTTRVRCDIESQLVQSKCSIVMPNPDSPKGNDNKLGKYGVIAIAGGLAVVLFILLAVGSGFAYQVRRKRRNTILDMEEPVENPLALVIDARLKNST